MIWTKGKKISHGQRSKRHCSFAFSAEGFVLVLVFCFFASNTLEAQNMFSLQPGVQGSKSEPAALTLATTGNPEQLPRELPDRQLPARSVKVASVLEQGAKPAAQFVKDLAVEGAETPDRGKINSFIAGVNQVLQSHGRAPLDVLEAKPATVSLSISYRQGTFEITPSHLHLTSPNQTIGLVLEGFAGVLPQLFVRDPQLLRWDEVRRQLISSGEGNTEVYIVGSGGMHILPVSIGGESPQQGLTQLSALDRISLLVQRALPSLAQGKPLSPVGGEEVLGYGLAERAMGYTKVVLRIVDERSRFDGNEAQPSFFPAGGVSVHLLGTEYSVTTDSQGLSQEIVVPENSRLLVAISDPHNLYHAAVHEVLTPAGDSQETITLRVMRTMIHEQLLQIIGLAPDEQRGSFCGTIRGAGKKAQAGIRVGIDWEGIQALYFNNFALPEVELQATSDNGRFCLFNVPVGPALLTLVDRANEQVMATIPYSFSAGKHGEESINLEELTAITTNLASYPSAHQQLEPYKPVAMVDLWPLGAGQAFSPFGFAAVQAEEGLFSSKNAAFYLSLASDFESTLYRFDARKDSTAKHVTPLIPQGFIDDIIEASGEYLYRDYNLGTLLVEHGLLRGEDSSLNGGKTRIKLFDQQGLEEQQALYFGEGEVRKALFINLAPGSYEVMVESSEGHWLAVDTVVVYSQTLSYLRTGSATELL